MRNKYHGKDVRDRLAGTVLRYKGHPYLCEVEDDTLLNLYGLEGEGLVVRVEHDDAEVDISTVTLGYVNIDHPDYKLAVYVKREPKRQFKQCVVLGDLTQTVLKDKCGQIHYKYLQCKGFADLNLNRYPTVNSALHKMRDLGYSSVAVSKDVAMKKEITKSLSDLHQDIYVVYLKDDAVGFMKDYTLEVIVEKSKHPVAWKEIVRLLKEVPGWSVKCLK